MSAQETKDPTNQAELDKDTQAFVAQMQRIMAGTEDAPNETVSYLLEKFAAVKADAEAAQKKLVEAQEELLKLAGKAQQIEQDLRHWATKGKAEA